MTNSVEFIPYDYQKRVISETTSNPFFGVIAHPGLGKTAISLSTIYSFKRPTLIVVPLMILYSTWLTEHSKWSQFNNLKVTVLHGPNKDANFNKTSGVYLINPEGIPWLLEKIQTTKRFPFHALFVDESTRFKNPQSKRFKALKKLLKTFKRRYILTGNPLPNGNYMDLWAQIFVLDMGKRLGTSFYKYRDKYFYPTDFKRWNWELKPGAQEAILEAIADICIFVDLEEALNDYSVPEIIEVNRYYDLPAEARKQYKMMEGKLFSDLEEYGERILAPSRSVALMKCRQIAQGFLIESLTDEQKVKKVKPQTYQVHTAIVSETEAVLDEIEDPLVIAYYFHEDKVRLKEIIKKRTGEYPPDIGTDLKDKSEIRKIEKDWNDGKLDYVLIHPDSGAHGLNFQYGPGRTVLFYSLIYNYDSYDQLIRRLVRQGSKHDKVIVIRMMAKDSIHEAMVDSLARKDATGKDFVNSLLDYRKERGYE